MTPKAQVIKEKIDELDFINSNNFSPLKNTIKKVKWQPTDREIIHVKHVSIRDLYAEYITNPYNSKIKSK